VQCRASSPALILFDLYPFSHRIQTRENAMPSDQKTFRAVARLFLFAAPLAITACASNFGPTAMPTGYKYQVNQYRTSAGEVTPHEYPGQNGPAAAPANMQPMAGNAMAPAADTSSSIPPAEPVMATPIEASANFAPADTAPAMAAVEVTPQWRSAAAELLSKLESGFGRLQDPVFLREAAPGQQGAAEFRQALTDALTARKYKIGADEKAPFQMEYGVESQGPSSQLSLAVFGQGRQLAKETGSFNMSAQGPVAAVVPMPVPAPSETPPPAPVAKAMEDHVTGGAVTTPAPAETHASVAPAQPKQPEQQIYVYDNRNADSVSTVSEETVESGSRSAKTAYEERLGDGKESSVSTEKDNGTAQ
jgi:hypothetical protein